MRTQSPVRIAARFPGRSGINRGSEGGSNGSAADGGRDRQTFPQAQLVKYPVACGRAVDPPIMMRWKHVAHLLLDGHRTQPFIRRNAG